MALNDVQISQLPNTLDLEATDLLVLQRGGSNYNVNRDDLLKSHSSLTNNPHQVDKTQVSLGNVENYSISDAIDDDNTFSYASSKAVFDSIIDSKTYTDSLVNPHISNLSNPHQVDKTDVGLNNVQNFPSTSLVGNSTSIYATQRGLLNAREEAKSYSLINLNNHLSDKDNPHKVDANQVGLGNVPNWVAGSPALGSSSSTFPNELSVRSYVESLINQRLSASFPVGVVIALANSSVTPVSLNWIGTWELIGEGVSLVQKEGSETIGAEVGSNTVTLNNNNLPAHNHPDNLTILDSGHSHAYNQPIVTEVNGLGGVDVLGGLLSVGGLETQESSSNLSLVGGVLYNNTSNSPISVKSRHLVVNYWRRIS